jgi:hypothetical protein
VPIVNLVVVLSPNISFFNVRSVGVTVRPGVLEFGFEPVETPEIGELFEELFDELEELFEEFFWVVALLQAVASKTSAVIVNIFFIGLL